VLPLCLQGLRRKDCLSFSFVAIGRENRWDSKGGDVEYAA
jgi:hypothetical protein